MTWWGKPAHSIRTYKGKVLSQPVQLTRGTRIKCALNVSGSSQPDGITRSFAQSSLSNPFTFIEHHYYRVILYSWSNSAAHHAIQVLASWGQLARGPQGACHGQLAPTGSEVTSHFPPTEFRYYGKRALKGLGNFDI